MAVIVLDNGGGFAKVGYSTDKEPRVLPNCVTKAKNVRTRIFIGDQIEECKDLSGLYYLLAFQKGYLVNWDIERQVWDYMFGKDFLKADFNETSIIVTDPYFNFASIQEAMNEILYEEYQFKSVFHCNPSYLTQYKYQKERPEKEFCTMVVDTGYSFTHLVPYFKGKKIENSVRRVNVGGKVLTNHLKEIISYRQLMVMDETYVINQLKEDVCYVSQQFTKDMEIARLKGPANTIARDYVLPDYTHIKRGYVRPQEESTGKAKDGEQIIRMSNERFAVPELLFHPSDVGIQEMGIAEGLVHAISAMPEDIQPHMFNNIILTGGNCLLPGFHQRMMTDVRSMAPDEYDLSITNPTNPVTYSWSGGAMLAQDPNFSKLCVTREDYEENGHGLCLEKFDV
ncbi:actin-related protein 6-like isoform X1 [Ylistrum balloti]|uniref:actin-related protein 6-like isoform X1 n=2 Tax=Ylistrum balloti TaxID=509963 RepID=UPI002905BADC|nr:actin-related protein 6-like isoform X1 [Ylistrum balloti]